MPRWSVRSSSPEGKARAAVKRRVPYQPRGLFRGIRPKTLRKEAAPASWAGLKEECPGGQEVTDRLGAGGNGFPAGLTRCPPSTWWWFGSVLLPSQRCAQSGPEEEGNRRDQKTQGQLLKEGPRFRLFLLGLRSLRLPEAFRLAASPACSTRRAWAIRERAEGSGSNRAKATKGAARNLFGCAANS